MPFLENDEHQSYYEYMEVAVQVYLDTIQAAKNIDKLWEAYCKTKSCEFRKERNACPLAKTESA